MINFTFTPSTTPKYPLWHTILICIICTRRHFWMPPKLLLFAAARAISISSPPPNFAHLWNNFSGSFMRKGQNKHGRTTSGRHLYQAHKKYVIGMLYDSVHITKAVQCSSLVLCKAMWFSTPTKGAYHACLELVDANITQAPLGFVQGKHARTKGANLHKSGSEWPGRDGIANEGPPPTKSLQESN